MIRGIRIKNVATYGSCPQELEDLAEINFIYGSNGTGKTTISRVIADVGLYPDCEVTWYGALPVETLVYNRDFVERNFNQSDELKGIFTLGEKDKEIVDKIAVARKELGLIERNIEVLTNTLQGDGFSGGKIEELEKLERGFTEQCWRLKQRHDATLQDAFAGSRGSRRKFKEKLLNEATSNSAVLFPLESLEERAKTVFSETLEPKQIIDIPDFSPLIAHEKNPILKKNVIGRRDVDIAALIEKLGNSDWVRQGRAYYDSEERVCPFCQQETDVSLESNLNEYFDEAFEVDSAEIITLHEAYKSDSLILRNAIAGLLANPPEYLDMEKLQSESDLLDSKVRINIQRIEEKQREPSRSVELDSLGDVLNEINGLLNATNIQIQDHNTVVENAQSERRELTDQVWRYLLDCEIKDQLATYKSSKQALEKAIANIKGKIRYKTEEQRQKEREIIVLEKDTTSIQPTINAINAILDSFGFRGFVLAKSQRDRFYRIQRADGSDAKETLSEGEASFIAFLYFYHLARGGATESGVTSHRVVVFDDPVSSLDSDVLFLVSSLIKELFNSVREGQGPVKQVFVLTHNAYFHREVSFNSRRSGNEGKFNDESFWTVRKSDLVSRVESHCTNPIKSTYELLWLEVRRADRNNQTLQNTLRRILEHYFTILGGVDPDTICAKFEGDEKLICRSLFSWVNAGSHSAYDDPYFSPDGFIVETYLDVFKKVFEKTGHITHYAMMMRGSVRAS